MDALLAAFISGFGTAFFVARLIASRMSGWMGIVLALILGAAAGVVAALIVGFAGGILLLSVADESFKLSVWFSKVVGFGVWLSLAGAVVGALRGGRGGRARRTPAPDYVAALEERVIR